MAIVYEENFDAMSEGLSPPTGWLNDGSMANCEVDDAQYYSSPHSMYLKDTDVTWRYVRYNTGSWTTEEYTSRIRKSNNTQTLAIATTSVAGVYSHDDVCARIYLHNDGKVYFLRKAGTVYVDSGETYVADTWYEIKIWHNPTTNTYSATIDGNVICTDEPVYGSDFTTVETIDFGASVTGNMEAWIDNIQIGEADGWTGNYNGFEDPTQVNDYVKAEVEEANGYVGLS